MQGTARTFWIQPRGFVLGPCAINKSEQTDQFQRTDQPRSCPTSLLTSIVVRQPYVSSAKIVLTIRQLSYTISSWDKSFNSVN